MCLRIEGFRVIGRGRDFFYFRVERRIYAFCVRGFVRLFVFVVVFRSMCVLYKV